MESSAAVPPDRLPMAQDLFAEAAEDFRVIGKVVEGSQIRLLRH